MDRAKLASISVTRDEVTLTDTLGRRYDVVAGCEPLQQHARTGWVISNRFVVASGFVPDVGNIFAPLGEPATTLRRFYGRAIDSTSIKDFHLALFTSQSMAWAAVYEENDGQCEVERNKEALSVPMTISEVPSASTQGPQMVSVPVVIQMLQDLSLPEQTAEDIHEWLLVMSASHAGQVAEIEQASVRNFLRLRGKRLNCWLFVEQLYNSDQLQILHFPTEVYFKQAGRKQPAFEMKAQLQQ